MSLGGKLLYLTIYIYIHKEQNNIKFVSSLKNRTQHGQTPSFVLCMTCFGKHLILNASDFKYKIDRFEEFVFTIYILKFINGLTSLFSLNNLFKRLITLNVTMENLIIQFIRVF